jgi:hypothetical protein
VTKTQVLSGDRLLPVKHTVSDSAGDNIGISGSDSLQPRPQIVLQAVFLLLLCCHGCRLLSPLLWSGCHLRHRLPGNLHQYLQL